MKRLNQLGRWLLFLLSCALTASSQDKLTELKIDQATVELANPITVDALQSGSATLDRLRKEQSSACPPRTNPSEDKSCRWSSRLPEELRKTTPYAEFEFIANVYEPLYHAYELQRVHSRLDLAALVPVEQVDHGLELFREWSLRANHGQLFNCFPADSISDRPAERMPDNMASVSSFNRLQLASFRTESPSLGSALSCMAIVNDVPQKELRPLSLAKSL